MNIKTRKYYAYTYGPNIKLAELGLTPGLAVKFGETTKQTVDKRMKQQGGTNEGFEKVKLDEWELPIDKIYNDKTIHDIWIEQGRRPKKNDEIDKLLQLNGKGKEWFYMPGKTIEEALAFINETIRSFDVSSNRPLDLREEQKRVLKETNKIIKETDSDKVHIAWSIAPRGGKTTAALKAFADSGKKVMLLPSAVLSSHTSFEDDSKAFSDFDDMVYIETHKKELKDYKKNIDEALKNNKKVIVSVSLFAKDKRFYKPLKEIYNDDKFVVIDEGDFAAWTRKKRKILNYILDGKKLGGKMIIISMSGTNIPRMVTGCDKLDGLVHVTYMGLEQTQKDIVKRSFAKLKLGNTDKYINELTENDYFSYKKLIENPHKSSNFIYRRQQGFLGRTENENYKGLDLNNLMNDVPRCIMEWVSGTKDQMAKFAEQLRSAMPNWRVEVLNSDHTSNKEATTQIRKAINEAKLFKKDGVWIVSNTMGSRSFTIPEIQATIISYDKGDIYTTNQRMSRPLSPGKLWDGKIKQTGYIIEMSIDTNRDSKAIDILTTEAAIQSQITGQPLPKVIKTLLKNVSIIADDGHGNMVELDPEDLKKELQETEILRKVAFALSKPDNILKDQILLDEFLQLKVGGNKKQKESTLLPKANTFLKNKQKNLSLKQSQYE